MVKDKHLAERKFFEEIDHPVIGKVKYPGAPYRLSETPWQVKSPAPLLGQHNEDIYINQLGYTMEELMVLSQSGVI